MRNSRKSLHFHKNLQGKIQIVSKVNLKTNKDLTLVYTPGVAQIVLAISKNDKSVYDLTIKNNTVAVVTDGSAVLGLGNVGPLAALPVMEGKCAIFSEFAGINAFPICLATQDVDEIVKTVQNISPVFGGIILEDIAAPRCFDIEERLQTLDIPVVHDDQHATAMVVLAALFNAAKIVKKPLLKSKVVIAGAGAAGTAITKLLSDLSVINILLVDSKGLLSSGRKDLASYKKELVRLTNIENREGNLETAAKNADILIGVSKKGLFTKKIIHSLSRNPVVFALANPDPEVSFEDAKRWGVQVFATGRSDYPNQVNNALVYPGFFKGLLNSRKTKITPVLKIRVAKALASLIDKPTADNFIPSIFDKRVVETVAKSVSE